MLERLGGVSRVFPVYITKNLGAAFLAAILILVSAPSARSAEGDYLVGLNAFRDGLYEISEMSLNEYLADASETAKINYSKYLLYRIKIIGEDYKEAYAYFQQIEDVQDERFDRVQMLTDRMRMLVRLDCTGAKTYLQEDAGPRRIDIYVDSECPVDSDVADIVADKGRGTDVRVNAALEIKDHPESVKKLFNSLNEKKLNKSQARFFGHYFYKNGNFPDFWDVYEVYKDRDILSLAFSRVWDLKKYKIYTDIYELHGDKYNYDKGVYCRAIEAYREQDKSFDCSLADRCIPGGGREFVRLKTACLVKNGGEGLTEFVDGLSDERLIDICDYIPYMIDKKLYPGDFDVLSGCSNRESIAQILLDSERYKELESLMQDADEDRERYFLAMAKIKLGKTDEAKGITAKVKAEDIKAYLESQLQ
ncbi:hypothetical protein [Limisalsivibrio acetivorans]|uniref:hypothetical protein n=1 Tax=Limisalsivibrio acetivorans TaxID=1304888 RepID=UPI0003B3A692|nr:hypothetical protein [Limisalsivibrio acetivorans]